MECKREKEVSERGYSELKSAVNKAMHQCLRSLDEGDAQRARKVAATAVELCADGLNGGGAELTGKEKSKALVRGILAAACRDLADCQDSIRKVQIEAAEIERLWTHLVACMERLEYVQIRLNGAEVEQIFSRVAAIRDQFDKRFGTGLYANPEMVVHRALCSICNEDFRRCEHVARRVYDGALCRRLPQDARVRAVSFAKQPVDLRCRVWPGTWDEKTKQYSFVSMLNSFRVDDLTDPR